MEETIWDTFLDLKVDVISTTLALLERNIATRFAAVDMALTQMASSMHAGVGPDRPPLRDTPPMQAAVLDPLGLDTAIPGSAGLTSDDGAPPPGRFQATTTFRPGLAFPVGNRFSHMRDDSLPHADFDAGYGGQPTVTTLEFGPCCTQARQSLQMLEGECPSVSSPTIKV